MLVVYEDIQLYVGFTRRSLPHGSPHRSAGFRWFSLVSGVTGGVWFFKFVPVRSHIDLSLNGADAQREAVI